MHQVTQTPPGHRDSSSPRTSSQHRDLLGFELTLLQSKCLQLNKGEFQVKAMKRRLLCVEKEHCKDAGWSEQTLDVLQSDRVLGCQLGAAALL